MQGKVCSLTKKAISNVQAKNIIQFYNQGRTEVKVTERIW